MFKIAFQCPDCGTIYNEADLKRERAGGTWVMINQCLNCEEEVSLVRVLVFSESELKDKLAEFADWKHKQRYDLTREERNDGKLLAKRFLEKEKAGEVK